MFQEYKHPDFKVQTLFFFHASAVFPNIGKSEIIICDIADYPDSF